MVRYSFNSNACLSSGQGSSQSSTPLTLWIFFTQPLSVNVTWPNSQANGPASWSQGLIFDSLIMWYCRQNIQTLDNFNPPPHPQISKFWTSSKGWDRWAKQINPPNIKCHARLLEDWHLGSGVACHSSSQGLNILSIYCMSLHMHCWCNCHIHTCRFLCWPNEGKETILCCSFIDRVEDLPVMFL